MRKSAVGGGFEPPRSS